MRALLLSLCLILPAHAKPPTVYIEGAFGVTEQGPDLSGSLDEARTLGRASIGVEWRQLFIEASHISDVQRRDTGVNTLWGGVRVEF
jgi:hypothetical protein